MSVRMTTISPRERRHGRVRARISGTADRPRLGVFRSLKHVYAQIVDDTVGRTIVATQDQQPAVSSQKPATGKITPAYQVGEKIAELAKAKKITRVVFDRGGYRYHGRVKAVADGARAGGLIF